MADSSEPAIIANGTGIGTPNPAGGLFGLGKHLHTHMRNGSQQNAQQKSAERASRAEVKTLEDDRLFNKALKIVVEKGLDDVAFAYGVDVEQIRNQNRRDEPTGTREIIKAYLAAKAEDVKPKVTEDLDGDELNVTAEDLAVFNAQEARLGKPLVVIARQENLIATAKATHTAEVAELKKANKGLGNAFLDEFDDALKGAQVVAKPFTTLGVGLVTIAATVVAAIPLGFIAAAKTWSHKTTRPAVRTKPLDPDAPTPTS